MKNSFLKYMEVCILGMQKAIVISLLVSFVIPNLLFGQIISLRNSPIALDSLYESIQPLDTLFCHSQKDRLENYHDSFSEVTFTKGKFNSLQFDSSLCMLNNLNMELKFHNDKGKLFTIITEPNNFIIKGVHNSEIDILAESKKYMRNTQYISNIKQAYYSLNNFIDFGGVKISTECDTNFYKVKNLWLQFPNEKTLHIKPSLLESIPFDYISYEVSNEYILSVVLNRFGQIQYFQISNNEKNFRFWIIFRSKRKPKKVNKIEYITPGFVEGGIKQYPGYMVYSYKRNGKIKENRLEMNYCE